MPATIRRALALWLATSAVAQPSTGAESDEAVRVRYTADPAAEGCPPEPEFVESVRARLQKAALKQGDLGVREYRASVRAVGSRFVARLEFTDASSAPRSREVGAGTCADAARALALVTALAIDAGGAAGDDSSDAPMTASELLGLVPATAAEAPGPTGQMPPEPAPAKQRDPPERDVPRRPPEVELGVRATLTTPRGPQVLPGAELFGSVRDERGRWLFEVAAAGERGFRTEADAGGARFSFVGARLRGCALGVKPGPRFDLFPCVVLESGALMAEGFIDNPDTAVDAWFAAGVTARLGYRGGFGTLLLEAGPMFPVNRNAYVFGPVDAPTGTVHDVPPAGILVALGGALRIF